VKDQLPQQEYLDALIEDLTIDLPLVQERKIQSIFFGGGTPSLIAPNGIGNLLDRIGKLVTFNSDIEITLETNPGTIEHYNFADYKTAGINRISLGAQSFSDDKLKLLGRIHAAHETMLAIEKIHNANFNTFNIDIMHGLPQQTVEEAIYDLQTAIDCAPPHLSWYQLTIEPNTVFHKYPPTLPTDDITWEIQTCGEELLAANGYSHYEVSAFAKDAHRCKHNVNYWQFGDYIGIGAGAHGKITNSSTHEIQRTWKTRNPKDYLNPTKKFLAGNEIISNEQLPSEYMLNRLRLYDKLNLQEYTERTGLPTTTIIAILNQARDKGLLEFDTKFVYVTDLGNRFLNDLIRMFLC
jgi:oxygen-independent coproporphyrinogen-3 oxidase